VVNSTLKIWIEIVALVAELAIDVKKSAKGNSSAGMRTRKGLRKLKQLAQELGRHTLDLDKHRKAGGEVKDDGGESDVTSA